MKKNLLIKIFLSITITITLIGSFSISVLADNDVKYNYERKEINIENYTNKIINSESFDFNINNHINYSYQKSNNVLNTVTSISTFDTKIDVTTYPVLQNYDINNTTENIIYDDLEAYIYQDTSGIFQLDINTSYPIYVTHLSGRLLNSYEFFQLAPAQICLPFDNLAFYSGVGGTVKDILSNILGLVTGGDNSIISGAITYNDLYRMGYRIYAANPNSYSGINTYIYVLAKLDDYERIHFYGSTNGSFSGIQDTLYLTRCSLTAPNLYSHKINDNNITYYQFEINASDVGYDNFNNVLFYDSSNIYSISRTSSTKLRIRLLPGLSDYNFTIGRFLNFYNSNTSHSWFNAITTAYYDNSYGNEYWSEFNDLKNILNNSNLNLDDIERILNNIYSGIDNFVSNDYSSYLTNIYDQEKIINTNLVQIKDLISDLQVTEINNIYNDIINNYNIDIDTEINNYLDDLQLNINSLDINNPKFQVPSNLNNQLTGLKNSFSNIFTSLDNNNGAIFYIVPIVALIIGALL